MDVDSVPGSVLLPVIIYIHGFSSSPLSRKAQVTRRWVAARNLPLLVEVPALPYGPAASMAILEALVEEIGPQRQIYLIGSSLGGFYAIYLAERYGFKAALINPAIKPYELLADYLGRNVNIYTGESYELTSRHMDELLALYVPVPTRSENFFLLVQSGDETLDYRQATAKFSRSKAWIEAGGNHEFSDYEAALPAIFSFFGLPHTALSSFIPF